ncbi:hypothetical protein [Haloplanus pelagicus]|uniref:hypothetical protein n=1 Tax=Haloplanus pelagicus TaxID=2949995 RepID=UPI00203B8FF1|nr:hypothetical protein [Haloplanus sp. HW8-1]
MSWSNFTDGLDRAIYRQFDDVPGGGFSDVGTYLPGQQSPGESVDVPEDPSWSDPALDDDAASDFFGPIGRQFDDEPGGGFADVIIDRSTSIGPAWLDEATILLVVVIVIGAGLWLLRPVLEIVAGVTAE